MTDPEQHEKWMAEVDKWTPILEREAASNQAGTPACSLEREYDQAQQDAVNVLNEARGSLWARLTRKKSDSSP